MIQRKVCFLNLITANIAQTMLISTWRLHRSDNWTGIDAFPENTWRTHTRCQILRWVNNHNPLDHDITDLRSYSTGLAACVDYGVNCDVAERIGAQILNGVFYSSANFKRSQHTRTLASLKPRVTIHDNTVFIEPSILFLRCCSVAQRLRDDNVHFFE